MIGGYGVAKNGISLNGLGLAGYSVSAYDNAIAQIKAGLTCKGAATGDSMAIDPSYGLSPGDQACAAAGAALGYGGNSTGPGTTWVFKAVPGAANALNTAPVIQAPIGLTPSILQQVATGAIGTSSVSPATIAAAKAAGVDISQAVQANQAQAVPGVAPTASTVQQIIKEAIATGAIPPTVVQSNPQTSITTPVSISTIPGSTINTPGTSVTYPAGSVNTIVAGIPGVSSTPSGNPYMPSLIDNLNNLLAQSGSGSMSVTGQAGGSVASVATPVTGTSGTDIASLLESDPLGIGIPLWMLLAGGGIVLYMASGSTHKGRYN